MKNKKRFLTFIIGVALAFSNVSSIEAFTWFQNPFTQIPGSATLTPGAFLGLALWTQAFSELREFVSASQAHHRAQDYARHLGSSPERVDEAVEQWVIEQLPEAARSEYIQIVVVAEPFGKLPLNAAVETEAFVDQEEIEGVWTNVYSRVVRLCLTYHVHDIIARYLALDDTQDTDPVLLDEIKQVTAILQHEGGHIAHNHVVLRKVFLPQLIGIQLGLGGHLAMTHKYTEAQALAIFAAATALPHVLRALPFRAQETQADDCIEDIEGGLRFFQDHKEEIDRMYAAKVPKLLQYVVPKRLFQFIIDPDHPRPEDRIARLEARLAQKGLQSEPEMIEETSGQ